MHTDTPLRSPRIDLHAHMLERTASDAGTAHSVVTGFGARTLPTAEPGTAQEMAERAGNDPALHIAMLDRLELDAEVLSSMTVMQGTSWALPELEDDLNRGINDEIARWVVEHPTRMVGSFTLPLQSGALSLRELDRCITELGMTVVQLPVAVAGTYLSAPAYRWLWEAIAEQGLVAFVHPDGTRDPWFQSYSMWNSVGQPIEEAKFIASLIYEGILEQLPDLKIVVAHGGGYLPQYFGRLDRNVKAHPQSAANISRRPSEYLQPLLRHLPVRAGDARGARGPSGSRPHCDGQRLSRRRDRPRRVRRAMPVAWPCRRRAHRRRHGGAPAGPHRGDRRARGRHPITMIDATENAEEDHART